MAYSGTIQDLAKYIFDVAGHMHLTSWTIHVETQEMNHHWARIRSDIEDKTLYIQVNPQLLEVKDHELIRSVVVHELVHAIMEPLSCVYSRLREHLGTGVTSVLDPIHSEAEEQAVNELTRLLAPHVPMPKDRRPRELAGLVRPPRPGEPSDRVTRLPL